MDNLEEIRKEISAINDEMLALFVKRMELSAQVAAYKKANGLPTLDRKREEAIRAEKAARSKSGFAKEVSGQSKGGRAVMANRNRPIQVKFRVTPEERKMIDRRMEQAGINNMAAYLRKMAIDGYVVKLDLPELRDLISLLRRTSNNFNQIARRVNSTDRIYADDITEMKNLLEQIWEADNRILEKLAAID